jgi:hypothetical protein
MAKTLSMTAQTPSRWRDQETIHKRGWVQRKGERGGGDADLNVKKERRGYSRLTKKNLLYYSFNLITCLAKFDCKNIAVNCNFKVNPSPPHCHHPPSHPSSPLSRRSVTATLVDPGAKRSARVPAGGRLVASLEDHEFTPMPAEGRRCFVLVSRGWSPCRLIWGSHRAMGPLGPFISTIINIALFSCRPNLNDRSSFLPSAEQ